MSAVLLTETHTSRGTPRCSLARIIAIFSFAAVVTHSVCVAAQKIAQLQPQGYVSDFAGVLDETSKSELTALCTEVEQKTRAQIAVVTLPSLEGGAIEDVSVNLATRWGVGPKSTSRGVFILLVPPEHKYRIEVGYGLEPILPDGKVGGFGREAVPLLRAGNYGGAVLLMTRRVAAVIAQDAGVTLTNEPAQELPRGRLPTKAWEHDFWVLLLLLFFIGFPLARWLILLGAAGGRPRRRGFGGPWFMGGWGGGSWGGGGFGGGGGGGGFGGFGGGSFGGGGASGSW